MTLFDKDFDESLWLILEGDAEKRGEIIEFLNKIPKELMENIKNILKHKIDEEQEVIPDYEDSVVADDGTTYSFILEFDDGEKTLEIKQAFATPENAAHINLSVELNLVKETIGFKQGGFWIGNFTKSFSVSGMTSDALNFGDGRVLPYIELSEGEVVAEGFSKEIEDEYGITKDMKTLSRFSLPNVQHDVFPVDISAKPEKVTLDYINRRYGNTPKTKNLI